MIAAKIATAAATPAEESSETGKKARPSQQTMSVTPETRTVCPAVPARATVAAQTWHGMDWPSTSEARAQMWSRETSGAEQQREEQSRAEKRDRGKLTEHGVHSVLQRRDDLRRAAARQLVQPRQRGVAALHHLLLVSGEEEEGVVDGHRDGAAHHHRRRE